MAVPLNPFQAAAAAAVAKSLGITPDVFQVTAPPRPEMGDFAVGCFPAAKLLGQAPPALAKAAAERFEPTSELASASAAGPFVNFRANRAALFRHLFAATLGESASGLVPTTVGAGKTICIDYSSPNIAKHLAYHHIRSTVIGHALVKLYGALGYRTVGINHLGDWGTTHGMLLAAAERWGTPEPLTISALNDLYVRFRKEMEQDPSLEQNGREWFKRLEDGDLAARAAWLRFRDVSLAEFQQVYDQLGITFDEVKGESDYEGDMDRVIDLLATKQLTTRSEGALVVPLDHDGMPPLLLKKQDGATLYATRDLAAAMYRWDTYQFERSLYVVDRGQGLHFKQLFRVLELAGYQWATQCDHVPFGLVRIGGKKTGTRKGNVVLLKEVLAEAQRGAAQRIANSNPDLGQEELAQVARVVGVGAVVFANLVSQREKDVDFSWDDVLSVEGDSGPYVQYAHARCVSIERKAGGAVSAAVDPTPLTEELEWQLGRRLAELPDVVRRCADTNEPHILCRYLLDVAGDFARWYTSGNQSPELRVLCEDESARTARIALTAATRNVLRTGLALLGIDAPDRM
jgi:arginyl-tRNA synthetase